MAAGWPEKDDHDLLALIQDGSHDAFAVLVRRHTERFYRLAYRYVQTKETAEDIVQDAFLKLWRIRGNGNRSGKASSRPGFTGSW